MTSVQVEIAFDFHKARFGAEVTGISLQLWRLTHLATDQLLETNVVAPLGLSAGLGSIALGVDGKVDRKLAQLLLVIYCHLADSRPSCPVGEARWPLEGLLSRAREGEVGLASTADATAACGSMRYRTAPGAFQLAHCNYVVQWSAPEEVPVEEVEEELFAEGNEDPLGEPVQVDLTQVEAWDIHETAAEYVGACPLDASFVISPAIDSRQFSRPRRAKGSATIEEHIGGPRKGPRRSRGKQARLVKGVAGDADELLKVIGRVVGQQNVLSVQRLRPPADPLPVLGSVALPARRRTSVFSPHGRPDAEKSVSTEPSSGRGKSDFVVLLSSASAAEKLASDMADVLAEQQWEVAELTTVEEQLFDLELDVPAQEAADGSEAWLATSMAPREDVEDVSDMGPQSPMARSMQGAGVQRRKQDFCPKLDHSVDSWEFTSHVVRDLDFSQSQDSSYMSLRIPADRESPKKVERLGTDDSPKKGPERAGVYARRYVKSMHPDPLERASAMEWSEPPIERLEALEETWGRTGTLHSLVPNTHSRPRSAQPAAEDLVLHSKLRPPTVAQTRGVRATRPDTKLPATRTRQTGDGDWYFDSGDESEAPPEGRQPTDSDIAEADLPPSSPISGVRAEDLRPGGGPVARGTCLHLQEPAGPHMALKPKRRHRPAPPAPPKAVTTTKYFAGGQGVAAFQDWSQALRSQAGAEAVLWAKEIVVGEEAEDGPAGDGLGTSCYAARFRGAVADDAFRVLRSPEGREWRCYADTTEAAEADAEEVEEEEWPGMGHRPRRPRGGGGAPGGPYQWMGVSEDGAEAVLQAVEVRCMEPPAVLHVTFVSEVDDVASSAPEEDDPLEDNAALALEGLGECAGAEASLSPGQWTPLSGQSRATGSGPPSPPRSGSADSGQSSAAASLSSGSAPNVDGEAPSDNARRHRRSRRDPPGPAALHYFARTEGRGSVQQFSAALRAAVGDEAVVWVEEVEAGGVDVEDTLAGSCRSPCFAAKVRRTPQSPQALDAVAGPGGEVWTCAGPADDVIEDEVERHLERRRRERRRASPRTWPRVALDEAGTEVVLQEVVAQCMAGPPTLYVAFVSDVGDDTAQDMEGPEEGYLRSAASTARPTATSPKAASSIRHAEGADHNSQHPPNSRGGGAAAPFSSVLQWLSAAKTPQGAAASDPSPPAAQPLPNRPPAGSPSSVLHTPPQEAAVAGAMLYPTRPGGAAPSPAPTSTTPHAATSHPGPPNPPPPGDHPRREAEAVPSWPTVAAPAAAGEGAEGRAGAAHPVGGLEGPGPHHPGPASPGDERALAGEPERGGQRADWKPTDGPSHAAGNPPLPAWATSHDVEVVEVYQPINGPVDAGCSSSIALLPATVEGSASGCPPWLQSPKGSPVPPLLIEKRIPSGPAAQPSTPPLAGGSGALALSPPSGSEAASDAEGLDAHRPLSSRRSTPSLPALDSRRSSQLSVGEAMGPATGRSAAKPGPHHSSAARPMSDSPPSRRRGSRLSSLSSPLLGLDPQEPSPFNALLSLSETTDGVPSPTTTGRPARHKLLDNLLSTSSGWIQGWDCHTVANPDQLQIAHLAANAVKVAWRRPENAGGSLQLQYKVLLSADRGKTFRVVGVVAETEVELRNLLANTLYHVSVSTVLPPHFTQGMGPKPPSQRAKILHFHTKPAAPAHPHSTASPARRVPTPRHHSPSHRPEGDASVSHSRVSTQVITDQTSALKKKPINNQRVHPYTTPPTLPRIAK